MSASAESMSTSENLEAWHDLVLSDERRELTDAVRNHLTTKFPLDVVRRCFDGQAQPTDVWSEVSAADYPSVGLPPAAGGLGSLIDTVALVEAAGQTLLPAPLLSSILSLQTLWFSGLAARDLEPARPAALAVAKPSMGSRRLEVAQVAVLDGALAERLTLVVPHGEDGVSVAQVDTSSLALLAVHHHVDPSRPVAVFDVSTFTPSVVIDDARSIDAVLAPARAAIAADLTGIAIGALEQAVRYAAEREQFGKKIGAFQGIKHRLVDVYVAVERARSLTRAAAVALVSAGDKSGVELSLLAKGAASDAAADATRTLVQVLGAMGMTFESDAHLYFRRAQQTAPFLGSAAACYRQAVRNRPGEPA